MSHTHRSKIHDLDDNAVNFDEDDGRRFHHLGNGGRHTARQDPEQDFFADLHAGDSTYNGFSILDNPDAYESEVEDDEDAYPREDE